MVKLKDHLNFYKLAKNRTKSDTDYFKFESFQSKIVITSLKNKGISFNGVKVLDVGSGTGCIIFSYDFPMLEGILVLTRQFLGF